MSEDEGRVPCPWCAEPIMADAAVCRFCGRSVKAEPPPEPKQSSGYGCLVAGLVVVAVAVVLIFLGVAGNYG